MPRSRLVELSLSQMLEPGELSPDGVGVTASRLRLDRDAESMFMMLVG